jgi:hypothetical protein
MTIQYPFDPHGTAASNKINFGEDVHTTSFINARTYNIIIPKAAPYFADTLQVDFIDFDTNERTTLVRDVDFSESLMFIGATRSTGKAVYGAISLLRQSMNGTVDLSYQTVGGQWVADHNAVLTHLANMNYNPRIISWDQVTNIQETFPPTVHELELDDSFGYQELIEAINSMSNTILQNGGNLSALIGTHKLDKTNPHEVNAQQVGLGLVSNLPVADASEINSEQMVEKYVLLNQVLTLLNKRTDAQNNRITNLEAELANLRLQVINLQ